MLDYELLQKVDDYKTTLPEDRRPSHGPKCHVCGEVIESELCVWYGEAYHEECLREVLKDELEEAIKDAREDIEYWK